MGENPPWVEEQLRKSHVNETLAAANQQQALKAQPCGCPLLGLSFGIVNNQYEKSVYWEQLKKQQPVTADLEATLRALSSWWSGELLMLRAREVQGGVGSSLQAAAIGFMTALRPTQF